MSHADALAELMSTRWSCRGFRPDPVPHDVIADIVGIAAATPSWCNTQPWHLHVTEGAATDQLRTALHRRAREDPFAGSDIDFPPSYEGEYLERRRRSGWQLYEAVGVERGDRDASAREMLRNFDLFDAPHVAILTTTSTLGAYGAIDCGLFVQSFMLAAHAHGVASIAQAALAAQSTFLREHFGLDDDRQVLVGISFGYADPDHPANGYRTERQTVDEVATFVTG